mgnify:CR=1 FL=1
MFGQRFNPLTDDLRTATATYRLACSLLDELGLRDIRRDGEAAVLERQRAPIHALPGRRFWTREKILEALQDFEAAHRRPPASSEYRWCTKNGLPPPQSVRRCFETIGHAWKVAMAQNAKR